MYAIADVSGMDGILSVGGDCCVARDIVDHLLAEVACIRPATPVAAEGGPGVSNILAAGSAPRDRSERAEPPPDGRLHSRARGAPARRPVPVLVVAQDPPDEREKAELAAL
ncbi:hypothetical protein [Streptomyces sp. WAC 01325]|uniref:hypothetical protein n=1 Tax=Streptomyces sp. WAC 01325 TaxID=2203202 RepID=UPI0021B02049|nr:hypothetical protein [Streptomyces sp. WAC 01325]